MDLSKISRGENPPVDINVVIEVPANSAVKYEMDKESGAVFVDRILFTPMFYPCNYGFMPNTCLLYTSTSPRDRTRSRMPSSA